MKIMKSKKGTAPFIETLILAPIVIFIFVMLISNLFCFTKENSAEIIGREVVRACIVSECATSNDSNQPSMLNAISDYFNRNDNNTFQEYFVSEITIENLSSEESITVGRNNSWGRNVRVTELDSTHLNPLNAMWQKGNVLSIKFYFSSLGLTKNFGELGDSSMALVPTGIYLTIYQIIEND